MCNKNSKEGCEITKLVKLGVTTYRTTQSRHSTPDGEKDHQHNNDHRAEHSEGD